MPGQLAPPPTVPVQIAIVCGRCSFTLPPVAERVSAFEGSRVIGCRACNPSVPTSPHQPTPPVPPAR